MKQDMEQLKEPTPVKWDSETFYVGILLLFGPDPEAHLPQIRSGFENWECEIEQYLLEECRFNDEFAEWFVDYYDWLTKRRLGYVSPDDR